MFPHFQKFFNSKFSSDIWWNSAQLGFLIFPLFPALGAIPIAFAILGNGSQKLKKIIRRPLNWGIGILTILLIISSSLAAYPIDAFLGLANFLPFFLLFISFSELIHTPKQLRRLAWILVLPSLPIVILGLGQLFLGWDTPTFIENIFGWELAPTGNPPGRISSVFMYANIFAAYLTIAFILSLGLLIEKITSIPNKKNPNQSAQLSIPNSCPRDPQHWGYPIPNSQFLILVVIANAIAIILTNSRNAWAIAPLACLAFAVYLGWRWLLAAVTGIAGIILAAAFAPSPINELLRKIVPAFFWVRLTDRNFPDRPLPYLRSTQWQFATWMTQQRPLTGWGLRNFTPLYQAKYSTPELPVWLGHPHSLFLMLTAEIGIPAAMLFFGLVGLIIAKAFLLLRDRNNIKDEDKLIIFTFIIAFLGCTLFNTVDVSIFDLRVNTFGWLLLAAICGVTYGSSIANVKGKGDSAR